MDGLSIEQFIPLATFLGTALLGALALIGNTWGKRNPAKTDVEIAGALVDAGSVNELTSAIEAYTIECIAMRHDGERTRKLGHEMVGALESISREMGEMRREMQMQRR